MRLVVVLVVPVIDRENEEQTDEEPAQAEVNETEHWKAQLHLAVKLRNHRHLAPEACFVLIAVLVQDFVRQLAPIQGALHELVGVSLKALVPECQVNGSDRHELHRESEHHEDDKYGDDAEGLWRCVLSSDLEDLVAEEVDANFDDAIEHADEDVEQKCGEQSSVEEQVVIEVLLVVRG